MRRRALMTEAQRDSLLAIPTDEATLARHWVLGDEDLGLIARRRRPHNRFGFAVQLCALRCPGRLLRPGELIPNEALRFAAAQKGAERIFMDETRAPVLDPGRRRTKTGYFWAIVADDRGHGGAGPPVVMFHYAPGRGAAHALRFLEDYRGQFVQCDGYEAYGKLTTADRPEGPWMLVHCWTHARRRFVKRLEKDGSPIAEEALRQIAELYAVEKSVRGAAPGVRFAARKEVLAPLIAAFKPWLEVQLSRIPRSSKLAEDIRYTLARWPGLIRFLENGRLELDTNPVENQIRKIALPRKNALFAGHEVGAENWAMLGQPDRQLQDVRCRSGQLPRRNPPRSA